MYLMIVITKIINNDNYFLINNYYFLHKIVTDT